MAVKKVVDSWKTKKWFTITAPNFLNNAKVGEIPANDDASIINRIVRIPLKEITNDFSHMYTSVKLRVVEVRGKSIYSKFIGHQVAREYIRTLIRRNNSFIELVLPVKSKDGVEFTVKIISITQVKASAKQKTLVSNLVSAYLKKKVSTTDFGEFIKDVLFSKIGAELNKELNKIVPIKKTEVWKTELKEEFDTPQAKTEGAEEKTASNESQSQMAQAREQSVEEETAQAQVEAREQAEKEIAQTPA